MPIDYAKAGSEIALPNRTRQRQWVLLWVFCSALGAAAAVFLWPTDKPAQGAHFWFAIVAAPQIVFALVLGWFRHSYESAHLAAHYHNQHREEYLSGLISRSQVPLHIVASSHCVPSPDLSLSQVLITGKSQMAARRVRHGADLIRHSPLPEWDEELSESKQECADGALLDRFDVLLERLLAPVLDALVALRQHGGRYVPEIRLVDDSVATAKNRLRQLRRVLDANGLDDLEADVVDAKNARSLLLADKWLDREPSSPLLLVATQLHEFPPEESAEAGTALLMVPESLALPGGVHSLGKLHRPVQCPLHALKEGGAEALRAGSASPDEIKRLWIAGVDSAADAAVAKGLADAGLTQLSDPGRQHHLDRILGHAGVAAGWIAVCAAIESEDAGPQLVLSEGGDMQLAVVYSAARKAESDVNV
ncbi:hypothetical protein D3C81_840590 [compost metagenome]|uniref:PrgI family protein n=1 Tax=Cupriavidus campinensis TaxID=151783 RepID=A0ABY3EPP1_9BURK|nr:hypothetical protein [Cupriavidus campinensis]TSP12761.1 hypothetical protein FGG12_11180 [Cupriavidus campinensis]